MNGDGMTAEEIHLFTLRLLLVVVLLCGWAFVAWVMA